MSPIDLPEIELTVTNQGVTIYCAALNTPRFVPFEVKGRCSQCNSSTAELEYVLHREGLWLHCSRLKEPKFVPFDKIAAVTDNSLFRLRTRNTRFNIPIRSNGVEKCTNMNINQALEVEKKETNTKKRNKKNGVEQQQSMNVDVIDVPN